jgi:hypothetical protein
MINVIKTDIIEEYNPGVGVTVGGVLLQNGVTSGCIAHSLATAANDFLVASGSGVFVKKTLAETKAILFADGISVSMASLTAGDSYSGIRSVVTAVTASNSYGCAGYFETNTSGTQSGEFVYGMGSWINVTGTIGAGKYLCAQDNGIYYNSGTLTNSRIIFGLRAEIPVSMAAAGRVCPFSINTNNVAISALIDVNNISDLGSAASKNTTNKYAPYAIDAAGNIVYVLLYS